MAEVKPFKFTEIAEVRRKFNDIFKVPMQKFYDSIMSVACKCLTIDIISFDEWLSRQTGHKDSRTVMENVEKMYGKEAAELIDRLTCCGEDE